MMVAFAKAPIIILKTLGMKDNLIVTNDWTGGLLAAYCKKTEFGEGLVEVE